MQTFVKECLAVNKVGKPLVLSTRLLLQSKTSPLRGPATCQRTCNMGKAVWQVAAKLGVTFGRRELTHQSNLFLQPSQLHRVSAPRGLLILLDASLRRVSKNISTPKWTLSRLNRKLKLHMLVYPLLCSRHWAGYKSLAYLELPGNERWTSQIRFPGSLGAVSRSLMLLLLPRLYLMTSLYLCPLSCNSIPSHSFSRWPQPCDILWLLGCWKTLGKV